MRCYTLPKQRPLYLDSTTYSCTCAGRYLGDTCSVDLVTLIPMLGVFFLTIGVCVLMQRRYPRANNMMIFMVVLSVYDIVTDGLFV